MTEPTDDRVQLALLTAKSLESNLRQSLAFAEDPNEQGLLETQIVFLFEVNTGAIPLDNPDLVNALICRDVNLAQAVHLRDLVSRDQEGPTP